MLMLLGASLGPVKWEMICCSFVIEANFISYSTGCVLGYILAHTRVAAAGGEELHSTPVVFLSKFTEEDYWSDTKLLSTTRSQPPLPS